MNLMQTNNSNKNSHAKQFNYASEQNMTQESFSRLRENIGFSFCNIRF